MAGISETGEINGETAEWMQKPRCGMPDRMPQDVDMTLARSRGRSRGGGQGHEEEEDSGPEDYYVPGYKWSDTDLKWGVETYSTDLSETAQR